MGATIVGCGAALAPVVVTNDDLAGRLDTSDAWIRDRTGIAERRVGGTTTGLAVGAARAALAHAGCDPASVDALVLATCSPDARLPSTAALVQAEVGTGGTAFDLHAACAGFVHGLVVGAGLLATGAHRVLIVGAETMSRLVDGEDRNTAVLFGDGAGAVVLEAVGGPGGLLAHALGNDPTGRHLITAPSDGPLTMEGREVFRRAVRATVDASERALAAAGLGADDVDLVVPHQANRRILEAAAGRLGIPMARWMCIVEHTGNTSAASIPMALAAAVEQGRLAEGQVVLLVGFGSGMSWGSALVRWSGRAVS